MSLRVVGAGLPRTATASLAIALEHLLGGHIYHMREIPGHPFNLGAAWNQALAGNTPNWDQVFDGYVAAVLTVVIWWVCGWWVGRDESLSSA